MPPGQPLVAMQLHVRLFEQQTALGPALAVTRHPCVSSKLVRPSPASSSRDDWHSNYQRAIFRLLL